MSTVVKIGGCNGSGKTSLVRAVAKHIGLDLTAPPLGDSRAERYYRGPYSTADFHILGSYANACGGMDTISDKEDRQALVRRWAEGRGHKDRVVLFEGLITGKTYGAFGAMSEERSHRGHWLYVFMDTPFEECVRRVLERRAAAGNDAPFDPERTMRPTYKSCLAVAKRAEQEGHRVIMINHKLKPATAAKNLVHEIVGFHRNGR